VSTFENWARTQTCDARIVAPATRTELQAAVRSATKRGRVRAFGGGCALGPLVPTTGTLIDMRGLSRCLDVHVDSEPTLTVEAGMTMRALSEIALMHGLTVSAPTVFGGITIGGAIATASHGSGRAFSSWSDRVVALTTVNARGELVTIRDGDPDWPAASAGLGCFGIVYSVTLRAERAFQLVFRQSAVPLPRALEILPEVVATHAFVETYWFPGANHLWFLAADPTPLPARGPRTRWSRAVFDRITHFTGGALIPRLARLAPAASVGVLKLAPYFTFKDGVEVVAAPDAFHYQTAYPRVWDYSVATPLARATDAWRTIIDRIEHEARARRYPVNFVAHARYLGASRAWLSPMYQQESCAIEVVSAAETPGWETFLTTLQHDLFAMDARTRPHLGKVLIEPRTLWERFDRSARERFLEARERFDPERVFVNEFLERELFSLAPARASHAHA